MYNFDKIFGNTKITIVPKILLISLSIYVAGTTLYFINEYYYPILYWDQWDDIRHFINLYNGTFQFSELFDQHNEHRLFFPRIIFFADLLLLKGDGIGVVYIVQIMQLTNAILLSLLYKWSDPARNKLIYALPFAVILMFSLGQRDNFFSAFQIEFVGVGLAASLAFLSFVTALNRRKSNLSYWRFEACAYLAATIATFSIANGILVAFVLIALAIVVRSPLSVILRCIVVSATLAISYFRNFHPQTAHSPYIESIHHPFEYLKFVCFLLGNIFNVFLEKNKLQIQADLGGIGLIAALYGFWRLVAGRERNWARIVLLAVIGFALGTAMVTSLGRMTFGLPQANVERYLTQTFIFWVCVFFYWFSVASQSKYPKRYFAVLGIFSVLSIAGAVEAHKAGRVLVKLHAQALEYAGAALMSNVDATETLKTLHPDPLRVLEVSSFLREHGLSIFSTREAKSFGHPITDTYRLSIPSACIGFIDQITGGPPNVLPPDWMANGWAWNNLKGKAVDRVVFTTQSGIVIGFATGGWPAPRHNDKLPTYPKKRDYGWRGFLKAGDNEVVIAYALLNGAEACRFGQSIPSYSFLIPAPFEDVGPAIDLPIHAAGGWTINGQYPFIDKLPLDDVIYGSWSGKENNVGEMVMGPLTLGPSPLLLPIVTGPRIDGLKIEIAAADSGEVIATYALPVTMTWQAFKFNLPAEIDGRTVNIIMSDQGDDWGEWFGVGQPHTISAQRH